MFYLRKLSNVYKSFTNNKGLSEMLLFYQGLLCLVYIYFNDPFQVRYNLSKVNVTGTDSQDDVIHFCNYEGPKYKIILTLLGLLQLWILHIGAEDLKTTWRQSNAVIDAMTYLTPWIVLSVLLINPLRFSMTVNYESISDMIFSPIKLTEMVILFILGLPFSLHMDTIFPSEVQITREHLEIMTTSTDKDAFKINCNKYYGINFQWTAVLPIFIYTLTLLIMKNLNELKSKSHTDSSTSKANGSEEAVNSQTGKVEQLSSKFEQKAVEVKEITKLTPLPQPTKKNTDHTARICPVCSLSSHPSLQWQIENREKNILNSPVKTKPINIIKPLTFASNQNSQKRMKHAKYCQTENHFHTNITESTRHYKEAFSQTLISPPAEAHIMRASIGLQVNSSEPQKCDKIVQVNIILAARNKAIQTLEHPVQTVSHKQTQCNKLTVKQLNEHIAHDSGGDMKVVNRITQTQRIPIKVTKHKESQTENRNRKINGGMPNNENMDKAVYFATTISEDVMDKTEPIRFKACKSLHGIWYVSLRGDIFLTVSQNILQVAKSDWLEVDVADDILKTMKTFVDNYKKLSDCFDDEEESDDESFINGFRL